MTAPSARVRPGSAHEFCYHPLASDDLQGAKHLKITILAIGTRGDVQPCIALGRGLNAAGHSVTIAAFEDFAAMVTSCGVPFHPISGRMQDLIQSEMSREIARSGGNLIKATRLMAEILDSLTGRFCEDLLNACKGADTVIFSTAAPHGYHLYAIPEALGIPCYPAYLFPMFGYDRVFPHPLWPVRASLGQAYNRLSHRFIEQLVWQPFRRTINDWRKRILKLPPVPFWGPYGRMSERPILCGYSAAVIPPPQPETSWVHVTGFWFLDREPAWSPPQELEEFLNSGPAPVYIGFGSINFRESDDALAVVCDALFRTKLRAVMLGTPAMPEGLLSDNIYVTRSIPFDWLFPRMAAVVHHGGAGTTACGLRAGVPGVVIPFKGEQMFFGHMVARLGAGPRPLNRHHLTAETVRGALLQATADSEMKRRAHALGARLREEDGVGNAVALFNRLVTNGRDGDK